MYKYILLIRERDLYLHLSMHSIFQLMEALINLYTLVYSNGDQQNQLMYQWHHIKLINFYAKIKIKINKNNLNSISNWFGSCNYLIFTKSKY